ncbi:hypothetical protein [Rhizobium lusitanum]|uniref:Co-chaperonin GroES n=1 Tax=Rhizobium lusitanum TaxID=293958 RepID=A0A1C3VRD4_9HYPH|nr:hypothetical protein [Rhizobium lusitanum]SCB30346.1 hypothetical protein GA0061101_10696 [Rhizobium lusitanum]
MAANKPQSTKEEILSSIGDIDGLEIMHNQILVGIYMRGAKIGNIFIPEKTQDEDKWQGKVGLVLKKGPLAFRNDNSNDFGGQSVEVGDWVMYRVSDGYSIDISETHCRLLEDVHIKGRISDPSMIY